jgi:hypothetical protein
VSSDPWSGHGKRPDAPVYRLARERDGGAPPLVVESRAPTIFTPSAFDAARPFDLEITLRPGRYHYDEALIVVAVPE